MFSSNNRRFDNFIGFIKKAFLADSHEGLTEAIYEYVPEIFGCEIMIFMPDLIMDRSMNVVLPKGKKLSDDEKKAVKKIINSYKAGKDTYPMIIDEWYVEPVNHNGEDIFIFVAENKTIEKLAGKTDQIKDVLSVVASLIYRMYALEVENQNKITLEKDKLRTQILSSVSHDLKTPLSAIIGSLNLIVSMPDKLSDAQKIDLIQTCISEAHRLNNFITNILNVTRIETGVVKPKPEWLNLVDLLKAVSKNFRIKNPNRNLTVEGVSEYAYIHADPSMFEQIMFNILENAVKYSPEQSEIEISVEKRDSVDFLIHDHGSGIPEDMLEKIFDKYTRLRREDRQAAGTGLGLSIARALAELQGAEITAYNHKEGGAVFKVSWKDWKIQKETDIASNG